MSLKMTTEEREAFLAGHHVGVLAIAETGRGPLNAPIWYAYEPGGSVRMIIGADSRKARLIAGAGRASLVAQSEELPYKYVSVEGPVNIAGPADPAELEALAIRYLGEDMGRAYAAESNAAAQRLVELTPERWLTTDYGKQS